MILKAILNPGCSLLIDLHKCLCDSDFINITCNIKGFVGQIFTAFHLVSIYQQTEISEKGQKERQRRTRRSSVKNIVHQIKFIISNGLLLNVSGLPSTAETWSAVSPARSKKRD